MLTLSNNSAGQLIHTQIDTHIVVGMHKSYVLCTKQESQEAYGIAEKLNCINIKDRINKTKTGIK